MGEELNNTAGQELTEAITPAANNDPDNWDDLDFSTLDIEGDERNGEQPEQTEEHPEADQQPETKTEEESTEEPAEETDQTGEQDAADQPESFALKHLGQTRTVGRDEVIALAQKGLNWDHIRAERDEARGHAAELEGFLQELATPSGMSVEDLIDSTRAQVLADKEGIDKGVALQRVKLDRDRRAFEAEKQNRDKAKAEKDAAEQKRRDSFLRFAQTYPDVDPQSIPKSIWDEVSKGADLTGAYTKHENNLLREENKRLKEQAATAEKNTKNKERSTGSQKSAGEPNGMDAFDLAWYDGT